MTFAHAVRAVGVFFNVNANSGDHILLGGGGSVSTGSASYDTSTFVFDGILSSLPFTTVTFYSTDPSLESYNIPAIITTGVPEPASLGLLGLGAFATIGTARALRGQRARSGDPASRDGLI